MISFICYCRDNKAFFWRCVFLCEGVLRYNQVTSQTSWTDWVPHFSLKDVFLPPVIFTASFSVSNIVMPRLTPKLFQDPSHQLWHVGMKLPPGLLVLHFQFIWTWPKWNIPHHTGRSCFGLLDIFTEAFCWYLLWPVLLVPPQSLWCQIVLCFHCFFAIKRGKKFDSVELFLEKDELQT